ncbi:MAG TPA: GxGYxYP domain-containing protein, partial [Ktedonobacteraceae bacterium]|nr:GxGYxYP domain-containing protein [Ktedonobacteraceae bacterium]
MDKSLAGEDITWSNDRILPIFEAPQHLDIYHINSAPRAVQFTVATLVGLINRPQPRVYLTSRGDDAFWLDAAFSSIPRDVSPLAGEDILHKL